MSKTTRQSLLQAIASDSQNTGWEDFHRTYDPFIRGILRRAYLAEDETADVSQEVYLGIVRHLPRFEFRERQGGFRKWLRKVIASKLHDYRARKFRQPSTLGDKLRDLSEALEDESSELSTYFDDVHEQHVYDTLLARMQREGRFDAKAIEAFRMRVLENRRGAEVAAALDLTVAAVYAACSRVKEKLREIGRHWLSDLPK